MRSHALIPTLATFTAAAAICIGAATMTVGQIEDRSARAVRSALTGAGYDWAQVSADGLQLDLTGTAPDEATRFRALSVAGRIVEGSRVVDLMEVAKRDTIEAPRFSVELLRSDEGISLIGLIPADMDRLRLLERIARRADNAPITDLLQTASYPVPDGWTDAIDFGLQALERSKKAKISIAADRIEVTTMADSESKRDQMRNALRDLAPRDAAVQLDITAPRPVITPFVLRATRTADRTRLDACSAGTEAGRDAILAAAQDIGATTPRCPLGLGAPSPEWPSVATNALRALGRVGEGTLTISDLEMRLEADAATENFGQIAADLRANLPEEFTLTALQADSEAVEPDAGPAEFNATRSPEGLVQIRGRVGTQLARTVVNSFGRAVFSGDEVSAAIEVIDAVPAGWAPRVLAALDGLSVLEFGAVRVDEDAIALSGTSGSQDATAEITRLLTAQLGDAARFEIDVAYDKRLDAELALPSPGECVEQINGILSERQITFDPGSATISADSRDSVAAIAAILGKCDGVRMEVGGYTDSQGREEMNQQLSQQRAEAVLAALLARRVPVGDLTAVGYGEANPIADNDTAAGREANRRIEFSLLESQEADTTSAEAETAE